MTPRRIKFRWQLTRHVMCKTSCRVAKCRFCCNKSRTLVIDVDVFQGGKLKFLGNKNASTMWWRSSSTLAQNGRMLRWVGVCKEGIFQLWCKTWHQKAPLLSTQTSSISSSQIWPVWQNREVSGIELYSNQSKKTNYQEQVLGHPHLKWERPFTL